MNEQGVVVELADTLNSWLFSERPGDTLCRRYGKWMGKTLLLREGACAITSETKLTSFEVGLRQRLKAHICRFESCPPHIDGDGVTWRRT